MEFQGNVWKEGRFWLVEIPALDLMTQGKTKAEALLMIEDATMGLIKAYFKIEKKETIKIDVTLYEKDIIALSSNQTNLLLSLSLKRQREKSGTTLQEAAGRLGSDSPNSYAQYERGRTNVSVLQYEKLLEAANPGSELKLTLV
jgi:predicted RNase H-like HicB family nuclease